MNYAHACIKPGYDYFKSKFDHDLLPIVNAFKAARLFLPAKITDHKPDSTTVETLRSFKFLDKDEVVQNLKSELPAYLALAEDLSDEIDPLKWWEKNEGVLPFWSNACKKVLLCQPSSASVERVFFTFKTTLQ